jgi:hypothetical protein
MKAKEKLAGAEVFGRRLRVDYSDHKEKVQDRRNSGGDRSRLPPQSFNNTNEGASEERMPEGASEERMSEGAPEERMSEGTPEERMPEGASEEKLASEGGAEKL